VPKEVLQTGLGVTGAAKVPRAINPQKALDGLVRSRMRGNKSMRGKLFRKMSHSPESKSRDHEQM